MRLAKAIALTVASLLPASVPAATLHVADGDVAALHAAFAAAADSSTPLRVVLARDGIYALDRGLQLDGGNLVLEGNGATLVPATAGTTSLFGVAAAASLQAEHVVVDGDPADDGRRVASPLTDVAGHLLLRASLVDGVRGAYGADVLNRAAAGGSVRLENTTLNTLATQCAQPGLGCQRTIPVWSVAGELLLDSTTLTAVYAYVPGVAGIRAVDGGRISVRNSAEWYPSFACAAGVSSAGGNVWADAACAGPDDIVAAARSGALPEPTPERRGGLVATTLLDDAAYASAIGIDCLPTDARGALRPAQGCTPGALERAAQFGDNRLRGGDGSAGVWFDPANDGHYLQIQPLGGGEQLLTWMHFDAGGRPAWAYLVTSEEGGLLQGDAHRNRATARDAALHGGRAEAWGRLAVRFEDCNTLRLRYASDAEGPGSGEVVLRRLTVLPDLGCTP